MWRWLENLLLEADPDSSWMMAMVMLIVILVLQRFLERGQQR